MKIHITVMSIGILLFAYQNCSSNANSEWSQSELISENQTEDVSTEISELANGSLQKIIFNTQESAQIEKNGHTFHVMQNKKYEVSMQDGHIVEMNDQSESVGNYCLTPELKRELDDIMQAAALCRNDSLVPDGTLCSQVITPAYAELVVLGSGKLMLGYASNSCGENSIDLCGEQSNFLKNWFSAVKNNLGSMNCPN